MVRKRLRIPIVALLLGLAASPGLANPPTQLPATYAQRNQSEGFFSTMWQRLVGRSTPSQRSGSANRGGANHDRCLYTTEELLALVPTSAETGIPYLEPVLTGYPTWWFYVPYAGNGRLQAEFVLIDSAETILPEKAISITVPSTPGLMAVSWPETEVPLSPGKTYRWVFSIRCNPANRSGDATVNGWVQRATAEEEAALRAKLREAESAYLLLANSLYWFDLLKELHTLKTADPATYKPLWDTLLCRVYSQSERLSRQLELCQSASAPVGAETN